MDSIWKRSTHSTIDKKIQINFVDSHTDHRGGGLALISCCYLDVKLIDMRKIKTFEFALWEIKSGKVGFEFLGIYHSPPSQLHQQFIDEFLELFVDLSNRCLNAMIAGDFNTQYFNIKNKNVDGFSTAHKLYHTHLRQQHRFIIFRACWAIKN